MAVSKDKIRPTITIHRDLHELIRIDAERNGRSISQEIANILEATYEKDGRYERPTNKKETSRLSVESETAR